MKKLLALLAACCSLSVFAQPAVLEDALYVYRNDSCFNAFLRADIDSITYSSVGVDGRQYDDCVTQLIHTADSVYRIPLSVIDSISFTRAATILSSDVFALTADHVPYLLKADTASFVMQLGTPSDRMPKLGNVAVSTYDCTSFPNGIMARVTEIRRTSEGFEFVCTKASLDDVYSQIAVMADAYVPADETGGAAPALGVNALWNMNVSRNNSFGNTNVETAVNNRTSLRVGIFKLPGVPLRLQLDMHNELRGSFHIDASGLLKDNPSAFPVVNTVMPGRVCIPECPFVWLQPEVAISGCMKETGSVQCRCFLQLSRTDRNVMTFDNGTWKFRYLPSVADSTHLTDANMQGSVEMGLQPSLSFALNGSSSALGFSSKAGIRETVSFPLGTDGMAGKEVYEACKDGYCEAVSFYETTLSVAPQWLMFHPLHDSFAEKGPVFSETYSGTVSTDTAKYLLPLFSVPVYAQGATSAEGLVSTVLSRNLAVPVTVGLRLYDADGVLQGEYAVKDTTAICDALKIANIFNGLEEGRSYLVRPTVTIFNRTLEAMPESEFLVAPPAVDLGLSVRWAVYNVGANTADVCGKYYAWGETEEKRDYTYTNYLHYLSSSDTYADIGNDISGTQYDVAHVKWGGIWRMPTSKEMDELLNNCSFSWARQNGVNGCLFTAANGNSLFLPAAGFRDGTYICNKGNSGFYALSSHDAASTYDAYYLSFCTSGAYTDLYGFRRSGFTVRPVCPK